MLVAVTISQIRAIARTVGSTSQSISRRNDTFSEAGVRPLSSSSIGDRARRPKTTATRVWPIILALLRRPRLRCLEILMKSSRKPTMPIPTKRKSSSSADADGGVQVSSLAVK